MLQSLVGVCLIIKNPHRGFKSWPFISQLELFWHVQRKIKIDKSLEISKRQAAGNLAISSSDWEILFQDIASTFRKGEGDMNYRPRWEAVGKESYIYFTELLDIWRRPRKLEGCLPSPSRRCPILPDLLILISLRAKSWIDTATSEFLLDSKGHSLQLSKTP